MAFVNLFASSTSALRSNASAFKVIGDNIANSVTPGYKAADTRFVEVLTATASGIYESYGGVRPSVQNFIDKQGTLEQTQRALDVALVGRGFLVSNTEVDGSGQYQLGRAGQFISTAVLNGSAEESYLTDTTGAFILGWQADASGTINTGTDISSLSAIRVDPASVQYEPVATTVGSYNAILPADEAAGTVRTGSMPVIDVEGVQHALSLQFTKSATPYTWDLVTSVSDGTVTAGSPVTLTFDVDGTLLTPTSQPIGLAFSGTGGSTSVNMDLSAMRELGAPFTTVGFSQNGIPAGELRSLSFDENGVLSGLFSNGLTRTLYKLPVGMVQSPNLLDPIDGTHFALTDKSGALTLFDAAATGMASFAPGTLEQSTTDLSAEFNKMIQTQQSYSTAVRAYTVAEEMTRVATQLKS